MKHICDIYIYISDFHFMNTLFLFSMNIIFPTQTEYSHFSIFTIILVIFLINEYGFASPWLCEQLYFDCIC